MAKTTPQSKESNQPKKEQKSSCCVGSKKSGCCKCRYVLAGLVLLIAIAICMRRPILNGIFGKNYIPENNWKEPFKSAVVYNNAPVFDIDLDLPMKERYKGLVEHFKGKETILYEHVVYNVTAGLGVPRFVIEPAFYIFELLYPLYKDKEVKEMIDFIVENTNMSKGYVFLLNFLYEIVHFVPLWPLPEATYCTSVVATNENGETIHGRNWDFAFPESLHQMVFISRNYKNKKLVYVGLEILGYHGLIQGYKPNEFSVSINARLDSPLFSNFWNIFVEGRISSTKLMRRALEHANTYEEAKKMLGDEKLITGVYYIMAGTKPYQGMVMARSADKIELLDELKEGSKWYLCQTNWDRNKEDPAKDLRRTGCEKNMEKLGKKIDTEKMMSLLNTPPSFNVIWGWTISSQVFKPKDNHFNYTVVNWTQCCQQRE